MKFYYNFALLFVCGFCLFLYLTPSTDGMPISADGKNGKPNSSSNEDFGMSPNRRGTTTVRHRKPNNEQQQRKDGPTLKRTMSALGVAALTLGAGPSVEAGRPLGAKMEQTIVENIYFVKGTVLAPPPPGPMQMNRNVNSSTLAPPPPATEGTLAPPPPATEGALAPTPPAGGLVITGYPSANPDDYFGKNANEPKHCCRDFCTCHCCVVTCAWCHDNCCPPEN